ncbi:MAG: cupredoxin domain-containing protein [Acidimicrobiales bacterium]
MRGSRLSILAAAFVVVAAACGDDDSSIPRSGTTASPAEEAPAGEGVTVVGDDIAFDTTTIDAAAGEALTITFDNRDDGIAHNLHVEDTATGDAMTEIEEGPITQSLEVTFDDAGEFAYFCDVHPQEMRGTVTVTP